MSAAPNKGRGEPRPDLFGEAAVPAAEAGAQSPSPAAKDHRHGHRARLRSRFMSAGADALPDYELMELLLFRAIPRRDVKPLAKQLLERFGDFPGVLAASPERLREVDGLGDAAIVELKIVQAAAQRLAQNRLRAQPDLTSFDAVIDYCRVAMRDETEELFRAFFLNRKGKLITEELLSRGTVDQVAVYPREVVKRALELSASAVILAHNHPSGDPTPSRADIAMTREIATALKTVRVELFDHVVIGHSEAISMKGQGLF
ncbi:MAG: DNA repair protein RadC [Neomegalonema sp.]|nr:DNA repair protein RadC [Neomegalonema sp.]